MNFERMPAGNLDRMLGFTSLALSQPHAARPTRNCQRPSPYHFRQTSPPSYGKTYPSSSTPVNTQPSNPPLSIPYRRPTPPLSQYLSNDLTFVVNMQPNSYQTITHKTHHTSPQHPTTTLAPPRLSHILTTILQSPLLVILQSPLLLFTLNDSSTTIDTCFTRAAGGIPLKVVLTK